MYEKYSFNYKPAISNEAMYEAVAAYRRCDPTTLSGPCKILR